MNHSMDWDVIVTGGGMAGSIAAVAAARNGARTLLIERDGALGGTMTNNLVGPMMTFHSRKEQVIRGMPQEVVDRLVALGGSPGHIYDATGYVETVTPFDTEILKLVLQRMVVESGAQVLLHTLVEEALVDGDRLNGVVVRHKGGAEKLASRIVVDASGDGDVAALAGAPFELGRPGDGLVQPVSLMFKMGGVDLEAFKDHLIRHPEIARLGPDGPKPYQNQPLIAVCAFPDLLQQALAGGEIPTLQREHVLVFSTQRPDEMFINMSRVQHVNPLDAWDLSRAELTAREQIHAITAFLQRQIPGFGHAHMISSGGRVGVRESRRIMGEYVLQAEDVLGGRQFADVIARSAYPIDVHAPDPSEPHYDAFIRDDRTYDIPYRCLVPLKIENLLTAGRDISTSHIAHASTRTSPTCMSFGQAAGTAAALALKSGVTPRQLEIGLLQSTLRAQGADLGKTD